MFVLLALIATYLALHETGTIGTILDGAALRVRFTHGSGLAAQDKPTQSLEIAGADRVFHPATAKIERDTLLVSSPAVKAPVAVRYAYRNAPVSGLYNAAGLPAAPFRTDTWPVPKQDKPAPAVPES